MVARMVWIAFGSILAAWGCSDTGGKAQAPPPPGTSPSLTVSVGSGTPGPADVGPAAASLAVLRADLAAGAAEPVLVSAFVVRASGTIHEVLDVLDARLHLDDGDGVFSPALDACFQGGMTFTSDNGVLSFAPGRAIPAGGSETWWVVLDLSGQASVGETVCVAVPDSSHVAASGAVSGGAVTPAGFPLQGNTFTIGHEWVSLQTAGTSPPDLWGASLVHDPAANRLILFGGKDAAGNARATAWALDLSVTPPAWSALSASGPSARYGHVAAIFPSSPPSMVMFGGWDPSAGSARSDTWSLGLSVGAEAWTSPTVTGSMSPVVFACACWPAASGDMILFGGCDRDPLAAGPAPVYYGGIHKFHFTVTGGTWSYWGNGTYGAGGACMVDDPVRGRVIVFGGWNNPGGNPQVLSSGFSFVWSANTLSGLTFASPPAARWLSSWTVRGSDQRAYLFGGRDLTGAMGDLRAYDLAAGTWSTPAPVVGGPPAARFGHSAIVLGSNPDRLYVFTGSPSGGGLWTYR
jgi:hypothetical protein